MNKVTNCSHFQIDTSAAVFGLCKCGKRKVDHAENAVHKSGYNKLKQTESLSPVLPRLDEEVGFI